MKLGVGCLTNDETQRKLQENMLVYRGLENRLDSLSKQQSTFVSKVLEIQNTLDSIEELKKGEKDILFPLGSAAYAKGEVSETKKFIVELGAGIAVKKTIEESVSILEKRKKELQDAVETMQKDIQKTAEMMRQIEGQVQTMVSKAQKKDDTFKVISG